MKKVLALLLAVSMTLSLVGCGKSKEVPVTPTPDEKQDSSEIIKNNDDTGKDIEMTDTTGDGSYEKFLLSYKEYPKMLEMPDMEDEKYKDKAGNFDWEKYSKDEFAYYKSIEAIRPDNVSEYYPESIKDFIQTTAIKFANSSSPVENAVCSPVNIYLALAMLAEVTDSNTQKQILEAVGVNTIEQLRADAKLIWELNYFDDGKTTLDFANSMWLNDRFNDALNQETLDRVADNYYASTFSGSAGDESYNQAIQSWLNEHTNNLLKDQAGKIEFSPDLVLALASTLYLKAAWQDEFNKDQTYTNKFHITDDISLDTEFMRETVTTNYYTGNNFGVIYKPMSNIGSMMLILPNDGISTSDLLNGEYGDELWMLINHRDMYGEPIRADVNLEMPKFDVSADLDIIEGLKWLGIKDVFDPNISDFTPLTTEVDDIAVTSAKHAARVKVDEEGVEAAAFTVMTMDCTSAMPMELPKIDFILNKPFIFVITGAGDIPLFIGTVNTPDENIDFSHAIENIDNTERNNDSNIKHENNENKIVDSAVIGVEGTERETIDTNKDDPNRQVGHGNAGGAPSYAPMDGDVYIGEPDLDMIGSLEDAPDPSLTKPVDPNNAIGGGGSFAPVVGGATSEEEAMNNLREQGCVLPGDPGYNERPVGY